MPSEQEEALFWAGKAADAHHNMAETVRSTAGKWQAGIAALLGAYATVNFVLAPSTLATLPVSGWIRDVILAAMCLAGVFGIVAILFANIAASGFPFVGSTPLTGVEMAQGARTDAQDALRDLNRAKFSTAIAGILAVGASMSLLIFAVAASTPAPNAVLVTTTGTYCGSITTTNGVVSLSLSNGKLIPVDGGTLTVVSSCGS